MVGLGSAFLVTTATTTTTKLENGMVAAFVARVFYSYRSILSINMTI